MQIIKQALDNATPKKKKNKIVLFIEKKLEKINLDHGVKNTVKAIQIIIEMAVLGVIYVLYCFKFFQGIWYLHILIVISTLIFLWNYLDVRLELIKRQATNDIPKTTRKIRHYLTHTKNISKALDLTEKKAPATTKHQINRMKNAINSPNPKEEMDKFTKSVSDEWLKIESKLIYYCKINGDVDQSVSKNLNKVTNIIDFVNLQQGLDNAEILWSQIFVFILPLVGLPYIQYFNDMLFESFEQTNLYLTTGANIEAAKILFMSNLFTVFIAWIRKNNQ